MKADELIRENRRRCRASQRLDRQRSFPPEGSVADEMARFRDDFELWAARCVTIRHKLTGEMVPFVLNRPQRMVLERLERQRRAGRPIRLILLKARQWGGSTLIQMYMAWIQLVHHNNWHSLICAHVKDTSAHIRSMYATMLDNYPERYWPDGVKPTFSGFERSINTRYIASRGCKVTLASSENQDSARGNDYSMVHLSEVAFWKASDRHSPLDYVRAVCSGVPLRPDTLIVIESTANGVGNYFHSEWLRAVEGRSAFEPVFIPWYHIAHNSLDVSDAAALYDSLDSYERALWQNDAEGITLERLNWYHTKRLEYQCHSAMKAEYPSTATEAFVNSGAQVFPVDMIERLRRHCTPPTATGEVHGGAERGPASLRSLRFVDDAATGRLKVWDHPAADGRYITVVDPGGRSADSDYSVIAVLRRPGPGSPLPAVVAQWRGHDDHDVVAWRAARIATYYNNARLVLESNTFETDDPDSRGGYILLQLKRAYRNIYQRTVTDPSTALSGYKVGFHTNRATKQMIIHELIAAVRECAYVERDNEACNELMTYERRPNGSYGARQGYHDDILMTRAIGLFVMGLEPEGGVAPEMRRYFTL